jgi:hypothetical protein
MAGQFSYPKHFSKAVMDLVSKLLNPKATKRLGVVKGGAKNIMLHPWFKGFSWDGLEAGTIKAPISVEIKNIYDLSNFEQYSEDLDWEDYEDNGTGWDDTF